MRKQTANFGAATLATNIRRKIKRLQLNAPYPTVEALDQLLAWLNEWDTRAGAREGGLGKKPKVAKTAKGR